MKYLTLILLTLLMFGCKSTTTYKGYETEFNRDNQKLDVVIKTFDSEQDMREALIGVKQEAGTHIFKGLAIYYLNSNECAIYIVKPSQFNGRGDYATTLGHELMHCIYGDYHQ